MAPVRCDLPCDKKKGKEHIISDEQSEILNFRFGFEIRYLCDEHFQDQFSRYKGWHQKCSDPSHRHKKVVKSNLIEVSLDTAKDVKMFSEYCVVPGQKLCKYCLKFLLEIVNEAKLLQLKQWADEVEESRAENDTSGDSPW